MKTIAPFGSALAFVASVSALSYSTYTDKNGIDFYRASFDATNGVGSLGISLPAASQTQYEDEYIGNIAAPIADGDESWFAITHSTGMTNNILLVTWLEGETIHKSFRFATGYDAPEIYTGNATLIPISETINATHYEISYRCKSCWVWDQDGVEGDMIPKTTASAGQIMGWAEATAAPANPSEDDSSIEQHVGSGLMGIAVGSARNSDYTSWIELASETAAPTKTASGGGASATKTASGSATATKTTASTATSVACPTDNPAVDQLWDYIVVGAGAAGIATADKLSEDGASVLLVERGPPSSGRWGGTLKPDWLNGTNLTRFDVPGLDNEIWVDSAGIACKDYSVMAGCVLGGGTAVNAGLWWRATPADFDYNFPDGWKAADLEPAIERTFERIPFTDRPSMDGVLYKPQGYDIIGGALAASGWDNITANAEPASKNFTFSHPEHMFSGGERGGPLATYLVTASERDNFQLVHSTAVNRVVRTGSQITGVELQAYLKGGQCGVVKVKTGGKVILSAGAFGTPKILFRSGIGPADQLAIVSKAEGDKMIKKASWINLPVGENLDDHTNTDIVITHPDVEFYDFYAAYDKPIKADKNKYLDSRSGILAQSAPNIGPMFWQEIEGSDGITRALQWQARVEGSHDITSNKSMTISQYLGRGKTSRGRATINGALNMVVSKTPYVNTDEDVAAIAAGIDMLKEQLASDPNIDIVYPPKNMTTTEFLAQYPDTTGSRSANHWLGSCKMGLDSGLTNGTAVVDLDTKVYGTDNLFVVDASIFPGMVTTNPSALIVAVAEHAAPLIAAAAVGSGNGTNSTLPAYPGTAVPSATKSSGGTGASSVVAPVGTGASSIVSSPASTSSAGIDCPVSYVTKSASSTKAAATTTAVNSAASSVVIPAESSAAPAEPSSTAPAEGGSGVYEQCGGNGFSGGECASGLICHEWNEYYSQCLSQAP